MMMVKPLIHPIVHAHTSWLQRKKIANLQVTLKLHMQFYNRISSLQRSPNKNWHAHYSLHTRSMATNASMSQGEFTRDLGMCVFLASVAGLPQLLKGL